MQTSESIILYTSEDGRSSVALYARDGSVWLNQLQMAELFATSKPNISMRISSILKDRELDAESVVKEYLTTASDGKKYKVIFYSLEMIMAVGFRPSQTNRSHTGRRRGHARTLGVGKGTEAEIKQNHERFCYTIII